MAKLVYQTGKPVQRTDYLGPYQYEGDSLRFFPHAAGRVLRSVSYDAAHQAHVRYQREYTLKDHLGNLRLAYRAGQRRTYLATLEQDSTTRQRETQQFDSLSVSPPVAQATPLTRTGQYAARLNAGGSQPQPLGPLTQLSVQAGDTVIVTAHGFYQQPVQHSFFFALAAWLSNLLQPAPGAPAGMDGRPRRDLPLLQVGVAAGLTQVPQLSGGVPQGYLRLLVFDRDSVLVSQELRQLTQTARNHYDALQVRVVVPQDGYVTAYVGNGSEVDVLFDDVRVEHWPGVQVQEVQYDPAGLELAGLAPPSPGIKGLNNYRFNGKELQADLGLAWNHQDWRFFNPQIFTWNGVDPEIENGQESWSPYSFGYDNAVRYADANGRWPGLPDIKATIHETFRSVARGIASLTGHRSDELAYAVRHPIVSLNNGYILGSVNGVNTSADGYAVVANNIGLNSTLPGNHAGLQNGLRHIVWQALMAQREGAQLAAEAEKAHGDGDPNVGGRYPNPSEWDSRADTFNNAVGRLMGANPDNANKTPQEFALMALEKISRGEARQVGSGTLVPTKLTGKQNQDAQRAISNMSCTGLTPSQAKEAERRQLELENKN